MVLTYYGQAPNGLIATRKFFQGAKIYIIGTRKYYRANNDAPRLRTSFTVLYETNHNTNHYCQPCQALNRSAFWFSPNLPLSLMVICETSVNIISI